MTLLAERPRRDVEAETGAANIVGVMPWNTIVLIVIVVFLFALLVTVLAKG